jgi:hypothetical protein
MIDGSVDLGSHLPHHLLLARFSGELGRFVSITAGRWVRHRASDKAAKRQQR